MTVVPVPGLDATEYLHPFDAKALKAVETIPGINKAISKIWGQGLEKLILVEVRSADVRVTPRNYPDLHAVLEEVCLVLNKNESPRISLYLSARDHIAGSMSTGVEHPVIILDTQLVEDTDDDQLRYIIGREVGHLKSGYILYHMTATLLGSLGSMTGDLTLGIGSLVSLGVKVPLSYWSRMSNLSSDRAGLLACQNLDSALTVMLKQAGAPTRRWSPDLDEWKSQILEIEDFDYDTLMRYYRHWTHLNPWDERRQQFPVFRAHELIEWHSSGGYDAVLSRRSRLPPLQCPSPTTSLICTLCGSALGDGTKFCPHCGRQVTPPVRYCRECGRGAGQTQRYCPKCGTTLG